MIKDDYDYYCLMILSDEETAKADPDLACGCAVYLSRQGYDEVDNGVYCPAD